MMWFSHTISTRAPREGSDSSRRTVDSSHRVFLPALPARGATIPAFSAMVRWIFLPALPARGATVVIRLDSAAIYISTRAPREGSDDFFFANAQRRCISTRAPREGSDMCSQRLPGANGYFYPRSPRGERPTARRQPKGAMQFLPALPARGATEVSPRLDEGDVFLPALPARGATAKMHEGIFAYYSKSPTSIWLS